jgi:ribosomal protein S19
VCSSAIAWQATLHKCKAAVKPLFFTMTRSSYKIPYTARFLRKKLGLQQLCINAKQRAKDLGSLSVHTEQVSDPVRSDLLSSSDLAQKSTNVDKIGGLIYQRSSTIVPEMIGSSVKVHTGHKWVKLVISEHLVGYKLGEFAPTKKRALYKKKKKR